MRHTIEDFESGSGVASYQWRRDRSWEGVTVSVTGAPRLPDEPSVEAFITEHYWGYTRQADGGTVEYQVEHPRWRVWRATSASLECDAASLYGPAFADTLSAPPDTAFLAEGSAVTVRRGRALAAGSGGRVG
jgi:hypothetical protein